jgi:hypothetical protein
MAKGDGRQLRIFCICGQKMRVSEKMFGRPGKCVACRQKFRVPEAGEIDPDLKELRLADEPRFLRSTVVFDKGTGASMVDDGERYDFVEAEEAPHLAPARIPLDIFEPLQAVASLCYRIEHRLSVSADAKGQPSREELESLLERARTAREELDEKLRERLMETSVELGTLREDIESLRRRAAKGRIDPGEYRMQVEKLRRRRDAMERRRANLRGWLAVKGPYEAGGYVRLPLDQVPVVSERIPYTNEPDEGSPLASWWADLLARSIEDRRTARSDITEIERAARRKKARDVELDHQRSGAKTARDRAEANIAFCRERLEALKEDYARDLQIVSEQLDRIKQRFETGDLPRDRYELEENELSHLQRDIECDRNTAKQALAGFVPADEAPTPPMGQAARKQEPPKRKGRGCLATCLGAGLAVLVLGGAIAAAAWMTDLFGVLSAKPMTDPPQTVLLSADPAQYQMVVPLYNLGFRVLTVSRDATGRNSADCFVERQVGETSWEETGPPNAVTINGLPVDRDPTGALTLAWNDRAELEYLLPPGNYRVVLGGRVWSSVYLEEPAPVLPTEPDPVLEPPEQPVAEPEVTPPAPPVEEPQPPETPPTVPVPTVPTLEVQLKGIVNTPGRDPRFSISVYPPDGRGYTRTYRLGELVYRAWVLAEYNPEQETVTLSNNGEFLVLRRGEQHPLLDNIETRVEEPGEE